jgi:predicted porin
MLGYALSKRTTAYLIYTDNGLGADDSATTYVGLKHAF